MNKYKQLYQESVLVSQGLITQNRKLKQLNLPSTSKTRKAYMAMLQTNDMILCSNRYIWNNLPINLTSQELESLFYQFGTLACFVENGLLKFTRFAMTGQLQTYGRLVEIQPIDLAGKAYGRKKTAITAKGQNTLSKDIAVIIRDYTGPYAAAISTPRLVLNGDTTIDDEVMVYQQLKNNIMLSIIKAIALCESEEQRDLMMVQAETLLNGDCPVVPMSVNKKKDLKTKDMPVELWNNTQGFDTQNYCQQINFYSKVRRKFNGIPAPDIFEKKERNITAEVEDTNVDSDIVLDDGLKQRQNGLELLKQYYTDKNIQEISVEINPLLVKQKQPTGVINDE